ncbi:MAG: group II intron reverse transcriptase/maturase [Exilibacterium sp.]
MDTSTTQPSHDAAQRTAVLPNSTTHLLERVLCPSNLEQAWKRVRRNKGAPGIDALSIEDFPAHFREHGQAIVAAVRNGQYQPYPVRRVYIEKEDGSLRGLGIATVFDRLIQQAIVQVLSPIFDPTFSEYSYGFRPKRSQHQAVRKVQEYITEGRKITVDVDLSKFFDRVNHDFLMSLLGKRIRDKALLKLIGRYLRVGMVEDGVLLECLEGVPQGGPLSPLLSNVVLDLLDKELERRGHKFARYADDFIILVKSKRAGERVLSSITRFVERKLKLKVNDQKSQVCKVSQCKFLGFTFWGKYLRWHPKALAKFKHEVRQLTGRSWGVSMETKIRELTTYLRGWINYFGIANQYQQCVDLDHWIRRRVRMCYWKQWRKPRTKVRNLIKLGVPVKLAISCGITSKGYWHSARTEGIHRALNDVYLENQGLISLRDRWVKIHYG